MSRIFCDNLSRNCHIVSGSNALFQADCCIIIGCRFNKCPYNLILCIVQQIGKVLTNLTGKDTQDIYADFVFSDDGREVMQCPEGNKPESTSYDETSGQCSAQFQAGTCANCKHKEECKAKCAKDSDKVRTSAKSKNRAEKQRSRGTEEFKENSHFRNGVESRPSLMRRYGRADELPVHGLNRIRFFFGNRIAGRNLRTYAVYCSQRDKCAQKQEAA